MHGYEHRNYSRMLCRKLDFNHGTQQSIPADVILNPSKPPDLHGLYCNPHWRSLLTVCRKPYIIAFIATCQDTNLSASARKLIFDSSLNFPKHISQTYGSCFYHIRALRRIRKGLSLAVAVALISGKFIVTNFFTTCQKRISLDYSAFRIALPES